MPGSVIGGRQAPARHTYKDADADTAAKTAAALCDIPVAHKKKYSPPEQGRHAYGLISTVFLSR